MLEDSLKPPALCRLSGRNGGKFTIRKGYLNLYVKGQSVGELSLVRGCPRLRLHRKYKSFLENGSSPDWSGSGSEYDVVDASELAGASPDTVDAWVRTTETYAGDEKRFIDDLVAVTPGTIDLEMALPADLHLERNERTAPRIDLVVAQGSQIAFWEAKCATNSELRSQAAYREWSDGGYGEGPHVLWQLRRYQRWMNGHLRAVQVRDAYLEAARLLLWLAEIFSKRGPAIEAWQCFVAAGEKVSIVLPPGIVVAGYCPTRADGRLRAENCANAAKLKSFDPHKARLGRHGATVVTVNAKPDRPVLPELYSGAVSVVEDAVS